MLLHNLTVSVFFATGILGAVRIVPYTSDMFGVLLAGGAGLFLMGRRSNEKKLTSIQVVSEICLCGAAGFLAHAWAVSETDNPRYVWSVCVLAGLLGGKGIEILVGYGEVWLQIALTRFTETVKAIFGGNRYDDDGQEDD